MARHSCFLHPARTRTQPHENCPNSDSVRWLSASYTRRVHWKTVGFGSPKLRLAVREHGSTLSSPATTTSTQTIRGILNWCPVFVVFWPVLRGLFPELHRVWPILEKVWVLSLCWGLFMHVLNPKGQNDTKRVHHYTSSGFISNGRLIKDTWQEPESLQVCSSLFHSTLALASRDPRQTFYHAYISPWSYRKETNSW